MLPHTLGAFRERFRELDRIEGQNLSVEVLWTERRYGRLADLMTDGLARKIDVLCF